MVQITVQIDGDKVTINQSVTPTKVENPATKRYFIVIAHCDKLSWVELVTENYIEAVNNIEFLKCTNDNYSYSLLMQENGKVIPCNGTNWDIDK